MPRPAPHLHRSLQAHSRARQEGRRLAQSGARSERALDYVLDDVDLILVMSVDPGFGGQSFIHAQLDKIRAHSRDDRAAPTSSSRSMAASRRRRRPRSSRPGADALVAGSAVFAGAASTPMRAISPRCVQAAAAAGALDRLSRRGVAPRPCDETVTNGGRKHEANVANGRASMRRRHRTGRPKRSASDLRDLLLALQQPARGGRRRRRRHSRAAGAPADRRERLRAGGRKSRPLSRLAATRPQRSAIAPRGLRPLLARPQRGQGAGGARRASSPRCGASPARPTRPTRRPRPCAPARTALGAARDLHLRRRADDAARRRDGHLAERGGERPCARPPPDGGRHGLRAHQLRA